MTDAASARRVVTLNESVYLHNDTLAARNRERFGAAGLRVFNLMSSPGAGKTALLARTMADLAAEGIRSACVVGDLATDNDARRLRQSGAPIVQIMTGGECHLEAEAVGRAVDQLDLADCDVLFIENVGNLVCPSSFDLGEDARAVLLSVTEGEDKPLKYPTMFKRADVVVVTKVDLADAVGFDRATALANIRAIAPQAEILETSARSGAGMVGWIAWISRVCARSRAPRAAR